jgi:hypothetical protein
MKRHFVTSEEHKRIVELYLTGIGCKKIALQIGIPWPTVMRHIYRDGLMRRKADSHMNRRKVTHADLIADYSAGLSSSQCAKKHGCSVSAAIRIVSKYGASRTRSEAKMGKLNFFFGKKHTERTKKLSPSLLEVAGLRGIKDVKGYILYY